MANEPAPGSAEAADGGGYPQVGGGVSPPLQARAAFLQNWDWQSVVGINRGACQRGRAQHGANSETHAACAEDWDATHRRELTLEEAFDLLRRFHRRAPFLFFNDNTFASIGRELVLALFSDLPPVRKREISSAVAHYIAGVLDREDMVRVVEALSAAADLQPGTRVRMLRGPTEGIITRVLSDGRVAWRPAGSQNELSCLPESLVMDDSR